MQEKEPIMVVWYRLKVPSLRITVRHHMASLAMLNSCRRDRIFNPQLTAIKNSYNKVNIEMFEHLLHTNMRYFLSILMLHTKM